MPENQHLNFRLGCGEDQYFYRASIINGRPNLIISTGCSWVSGVGEPWDSDNISKCKKEFSNSYPRKMANMMNADIINLGKPASSTEYVYQSLLYEVPKISNIDDYENVYVIAGYTESGRFRLVQETDPRYKVSDIQPGFTKYLPDNTARFVKHHTVFVNDELYKYDKVLKSLSDVSIFCKLHNFKCYFVNNIDFSVNIDNIPDEISEHLGHYYPHIDFSKYVSFTEANGTIRNMCEYLSHKGEDESDDNKKYLSKCLHPSKLGYRIIADKIVKFIKDNPYE